MKNKILLVEDDPFLIDIYTTKLKEEGFLVEVADNGEVIFSKAEESNPDIIVLDIVLPKMDGWEILKKLKSDPKLKDIKVIVFSNLGQREEVEKGIKLGAFKYLIKAHYTPSQVVDEIKNSLR